MELNIYRMDERARLPQYANETDAGMDMFALEETPVPARERAVVRTGIALEISAGYVGLIRDKSGLAAHAGITTMAGVVDAAFRGEVKIVVYNTTDTDYLFASGEKVAQLLIQKIEHAEITEVSDLSDTARGTGGFGSTGK